MTALTPLFPGKLVPPLVVSTVRHGDWKLADQSPKNFTMIVFYRGYHCSFCSRYLADLDRKLSKFADHGVEAIAISSDPRDRAENARLDWKLGGLTIGYDMRLSGAREWGLYISSRRYAPVTGIEEPPFFIEPGLFLVRPDNTLYWASVQTMPFARPSFADILSALDLVIEKNYPARGEVVDLPVGPG